MTTMTIYNIALITHLAGLALMAGATIQDFSITRQFWKHFAIDRSRGLAIREARERSPLFFGIGAACLIVSGLIMMVLTKGVYGEQLWFRIKFGLVILIIINGILLGRLQAGRLGKLLQEGAGEGSLLKVKGNISRIHLLQLFLFLVIFCLSVFKFN
jgi:type IV secretory pathway TrbD component